MKFFRKLFFGYLPYSLLGLLLIGLVVSASRSWEAILAGGVFIVFWGVSFLVLQLLVFIPSIEGLKRYQGLTVLISICNLVVASPLLMYIVSALYRSKVTPVEEIHTAIRAGQIAQVEVLVDAKPKLLEAREQIYGSTPLHTAARYGRTEIATLLIAKGADVEARDRGGSTPIAEAAVRGNTPIINLLLNAKANPNSLTAGLSPLHLAVNGKHVSTVRALLDGGAGPNAADLVILARNNTEIISLLRAKSANR